MNQRTIKLALVVAISVLQNYESQISHVSNEQIAQWTLHNWVGAIINVVLSGLIAWKALVTDISPKPPSP